MSLLGALAILGRHLRVHRGRLGAALAADLATPAACLLGLALLVQAGAPAPRLAAGLLVAAAGLVGALEGSLGAHRRLRASAFSEGVLASPLGLPELVAAELAFAALRAGLAAGLLAAALAGLGWLEGLALLRALAFALLGGLAMGAWALLTTAWARGPEDLRAFLAGVALPCLALSGAWFSPDSLPALGQALLWLNPLFHASAGAGAIGAPGASGWPPLHLAALLVLGALPVWLGARALRRVLALSN